MNLSPPSPEPITWLGWVRAKGKHGNVVRVTAQCWVVARDEAAALLRCGREEVECVVEDVGKADKP